MPSRVGAFLNGAEIMAETREGEPIIDDSFLVLFNAWQDALSFRLPPARFGRRWALELSTADPELEAGAWEVPVRGEVEVGGRSLVLLRRAGRGGQIRCDRAPSSSGASSTRRQTSTIAGSNCEPAASIRRRRASSTGRASR